MAKIKTLHVFKRDTKAGKTLIDFNIDINVNSKGNFYATLPDNIIKELDAINMMPAVFDVIKHGTAYADTLNEIESAINSAICPLIEYKQVENIIVIKYKMSSACVYVKSKDGRYFPHSVLSKDIEYVSDSKGDPLFIHGTENRDCTNKGSYYIKVSCFFRRKITNKYPDGTCKTYYDYIEPKDLEENGIWLHDLIGMFTDDSGWFDKIDHLPEIEYNEKNALFFRQFITGIFKINDYIRSLNDTNMLKEVINHNKALLPYV